MGQAIDVKAVLLRFSQMKTERTKWETLWKETASVINSRRSWWDSTDSSGKTPDVKIYDSTAGDSLATFSNGLQGYAVSPSTKFFRLKMLREELNRTPYTQDWLEEVEDQIYSALNVSSFYAAFGEFVKDAAGTGTGIMFVEDDPVHRMINFSTRHPKECYIAEDQYGQVDTLYRFMRVPVRTMVQKFGRGKLDTAWQNLYDSTPDALVDLLHVVYPRGTEGPDQLEKAFASAYIDPSSEKILDEGGYDDFPYLVWRYTKNSDEVYGRGIGTDALPEILRANQMAKTLLMAGELTVNPPFNIPQGMKGRERIVPKGYNYYDTMSGKIEPIDIGSKLPYGWQELNDQRNSLKEKFYVNFFLMLESLSDKGAMTATEVMERQSEKAAVLGAVIGRLNSECLSPLIDRVFSILQRDGQIPPAPESLIREGGEIDIEYLGPLAQAQRRFQKNQGVQATLGFIQALCQTEALAKQSQSSTIDNFDLDELSYHGAQALGAPQKTVRETPDRDKIRIAKAKAIQEQMQAQQALEQQKMLAGNVDKLNQPMQKGSMLERVAGGR